MKIITKGSGKTPARKLALFSDPGWGKSAGAASAPNPIFIQTEADADILQFVDAFPLCKSTDDVFACIAALLKEDHDYQTVVLDSYTWFCQQAEIEACKSQNWKSIADPGFGKGEQHVKNNAVVRLLNGLDMLAENGINVIVTGHMMVCNTKNPDGADYGKRTLAPSKIYAEPLVQRMTEVLYGTTDFAVTGAKDGKGKAVGGGTRIIKTRGVPSLDAKTRIYAPDTITIPEFKSQAENNLWELIYGQTAK